MSELHSPLPGDNPEVVHEESDVNVGAILKYGVALAVAALVVHVFLWWLQAFYGRQTERAQTVVYPMAVGQQNALPPAPRLQDRPQEELRALRAKQAPLLEGYGWINKEAGIARMPIEEAMRLTVERGLPTRNGAQPAEAAPAATTTAPTGPGKASSAPTGH